VLYASNIDGTEPWADDQQGSIAKIALDGTIISAQWVTGLNGPKGMDISGDYLYVTDNDDVVAIDIDKGQIVRRIPVPGAAKINDLSVGADGTIYISDSGLGKIHKLVNGRFTTLAEGLTALNGVLHSQGELLFVADGGLNKVAGDGSVQLIAGGMEGRVDGVERVDDDAWLVSCWQGTVYYVTRAGETHLLLDGRAEEISAADLGYDAVNKIAYFPGFWKNTVAAYQLNFE
jgi:outer membrane protein assembly factor BamB